MSLSTRSIVALALTGVAGLLLLIAADRFERRGLIGPGLLLFAIGTIAAGAEAILSRYTYERTQETTATSVYQGLGAVLLGVALVVTGVAIAVAAIGFLSGAEQALYAFLLARPGLGLVTFGLVSAAGGGARVIGAREWRGSLSQFLASVPERLGGVLMLLFGLALVAIGAFELVAPAMFDAHLDAILSPLRNVSR